VITPAVIDSFLAGVRGQAVREGTRYAREARVEGLSGTLESVNAIVRGSTDDFEVALWSEGGTLRHRCNCASWRDPCKHEVAAALVLRQTLDAAAVGSDEEDSDVARIVSLDGDGSAGPALPALLAEPDPETARRTAVEARVTAARREKLVVKAASPPFLTVESASGFDYRVQLRGDADGPHSCDCPDFEANRLHSCKHVERVRTYMRSPAYRRLRGHRTRALRPRVYLHFGEVVEPRLFGVPRGRGAPAVRRTFDPDGVPFPPMARDYEEMASRLSDLERWVEPEALAWLNQRIRRRPSLPDGVLERLRTPPGLEPYPYQLMGAEFLARRGRALLADEMGLGKTVQAILATLLLRGAERSVRPQESDPAPGPGADAAPTGDRPALLQRPAHAGPRGGRPQGPQAVGARAGAARLLPGRGTQGGGLQRVDAPGGSGAFKQMLEALLRTRGPETAEDASEALEVEAAGVAEPEPAQETPVPQAPEDDVPSAGRPERPAAVDAEALAQAVAAVAPALPKEHRRSLALVFRALADVLEGDV
jgi:hypothetical protein